MRNTRPTPEQRTQSNSHYQLQNLRGAFAVDVPPQQHGRPVLLVDDVVDSRWTFAVVAALLLRAGSGPVFPLALAQRTGG